MSGSMFSLTTPITHQRLLVLHQPDNLHRLFLQLVLEVVRQRWQNRVKVLLSHGVVDRENGLMGQETDVLRLRKQPVRICTSASEMKSQLAVEANKTGARTATGATSPPVCLP